MSKIIDIKNAVVEFLQENIKCHDITVVKLEKVGDNWEAIVEVYEDDSFLKAMNLPPKNVRLFYSVKLDDQKEILAFERTAE